MYLNKILDRSYYSVNITLRQKKPMKLQYYGPIVRGWVGSVLYRDKEMRDVIFRNPTVDVRPYFMYTVKKDNLLDVCINFIGFSEKYISQIVSLLSSKINIHLGGTDCYIENIKYSEKNINLLNSSKNIKIEFLTPTTIMTEKQIKSVPHLQEILWSVIRSTNRFCKYYLKRYYPVKIKEDIRYIDEKIINFNLTPYRWKHKNNSNNIIPLEGVIGTIEYRTKRRYKIIQKILSLTQVFQIGKWISYGFGKLVVN